MSSTAPTGFTEKRRLLVQQIQRQGIRKPEILAAMGKVPREAFVDPELHEFAYEDSPLPIGNEQTISQPLIVALMLAELQLNADDRVLEIGTGSGYAAAVLATIAGEVFSIERIRGLADSARQRLQTLGFDNVHILHGDGTQGCPQHSPFDAISVAAGGPDIPAALLEQLAIGGRMAIPVGDNRFHQKLILVRKVGTDDYRFDDLGHVRFVPLIGFAGWDD